MTRYTLRNTFYKILKYLIDVQKKIIQFFTR